MSSRPKLLNRDEVEAEYGISRRWLETAAVRGDGPPMIRLSRRAVRYERSTLEAWIAAREVASTAEVA